ncbi:TetR/AcrR family transcriptional regulator [Cellulomonas phragmiteti]|uniref:TetR family transcriptional regulator n=1 Tax=Cellulomonas phragmiteti TaxID=478780 RepID=A0ABQ4DJN3_9CELL|nr:TetR/AcrR family transcriptional regulator [Cellulomonas phragmiteti]GIG39202.1 TetR family transcriptional regulator [Cellulomonas phragmiteti]
MDTTTDTVPPGLRDRTRRAVRQEISTAAMDLFLREGFEATTIDQIVEAAGISRRSFFRYFATKEDVVLGDLLERGRRVAAELARRPVEEPPWEAVRAAFLALRQGEDASSRESELTLGRMLHDSPTLRARHLEKQLAWRELLVPELAARLRAAGVSDASAQHRAAAIVATAVVCLDTASETWLALDGAAPLEDLWDEALAAVRG